MNNIQSYDYSASISNALLWRHNSAEALTAIITDEQEFYDTNVQQFLTQWYNDVFSINTATIFGLVVWAIILRLPITIAPQPPVVVSYGFAPGDETFDNAPFYPLNTDSSLTVDDARLALRLRYRTLTTNASVENVNRILEDVFSAYGIAYVVDNGDMTANYFFDFQLSSNLLAIIARYDLLPSPVGVAISVTVIP